MRKISIEESRFEDNLQLHDYLADQLGFPSYYGRNLSALDDCLGDVDEQIEFEVLRVAGAALITKHNGPVDKDAPWFDKMCMVLARSCAENPALTLTMSHAPATVADADGGVRAQAQRRALAPRPAPEGSVYLDNAATTEPVPEAVEAVSSVLRYTYGNASSAHALGTAAHDILEESRQVLANALGVMPEEVYFTSGATEANNLAVRGACEARAQNKGQVITSALEHPSVTRSVRGLRRLGWQTVHVEAPGGDFDMDDLGTHLANPTTLVSVMMVQNELGYLFPVGEIARLRSSLAPDALMHVDAVQAFGKLDVRPYDIGCDLLSVASHKLGGPKGIGALFVKQGTTMFTTAFGGGQERGLRSGTEPVFLAAGFAAAVDVAMRNRQRNYEHVQGLREYLLQVLGQIAPSFILQSRPDGSPYVVSIAIPGLNNQQAVAYLSTQGVYVSRASACSISADDVEPGTWRPKHPQVLEAAGIPRAQTRNTLRISFSPHNTTADIDRFAQCLRMFMEQAGS